MFPMDEAFFGASELSSKEMKTLENKHVPA